MFQIDAQGRLLDAPLTSHTLNPVPLYLFDPGRGRRLRSDVPGASLANVAATALELLGWQPPDDYATSLLL